jgi:hypothetical protein
VEGSLNVIDPGGFFSADQVVLIQVKVCINLWSATAIIELNELMDRAVRGCPNGVLAGGSFVENYNS